ncbi:MAG: zinc-dependent alcohol dehydrogenase family protein [Chloroflexota bacterium]|nr:zinc-dependent alcohol dehydrogenase family protein [Chloroflexota bacterium]
MRAAIIDTPGKVRVGTVDDPTPGPQEVVVKVGACGVCGTDLHIADGEFPPTPYPIVPGHEFAGEIVAVGGEVRDVREGQRAAIDPSLYCGYCEFCRRGHGNLCEHWNAIGDTVNGAFAEYVAVPAANVYPLPDEVGFREAALIEPISCAVHGMHRLAPQSGDTFLIAGAGTMGLILLQLALRGGASRVAMLDLNEHRLQTARTLGAAATSTDLRELREAEPLGWDCAIDATGVPGVIELVFDSVKRGGKMMVFGVAPGDAKVSLSPFRIYNDEITVLGSMAILYSFGAAIDLLRGGAVNAGALLTHTLELERFPEALHAVRRGEGVKVQVLPNG